MPELRRGVRRGRARVAHKRSDPPPLRNYVRTRAAVAREAAEALARPRTRLAARKLKEGDQDDQVIVISEKDSDSGRRKGKEKVEEEEDKAAMGDDSGGLSANKAAGQEEEGNTAPFPERVCLFLLYIFVLLLQVFYHSIHQKCSIIWANVVIKTAWLSGSMVQLYSRQCVVFTKIWLYCTFIYWCDNLRLCF